MPKNNQFRVFITSNLPGDAGAITSFRLDTEKGILEQSGRYTDIENPFFICLSPNRRFLYSVQIRGDFESDSGTVAAFSIDTESCQLRKLNEMPANGTTTCYIDVDPTGKTVVCANYSSGSVGSFPILENGYLGEMETFIQNHGASLVVPDRQDGPHAHCAAISPDGRHVYACDLGTDQIFGFALNSETATLAPLEQSYVRTIGGGGPRHFAYHPNGAFVYANNELANSINVYSRKAEEGFLNEIQIISTLPNNFHSPSYTADIKITPNGKFLYCSNRLHDSITAYEIDVDGRLNLIEIYSSRGNFAQNLAITPDGRTLLCANMHVEDAGGEGSNVSLFRINRENGALTPLGDPYDLMKPSCIMIA